MKKITNNLSISVILTFAIWVTSLSTQAGNVIIKKNTEIKIAEGKSSFIVTQHTASATDIKWDSVFGVCKFDCNFSGFNGAIANLTIDGKMIHMGSIKVTNSTIYLEKLGKVTVYVTPRNIVLLLTHEQVANLNNP